MGSSVFVLAVSGESPAVVLELLWWLSTVERCHIAGIEIWTTARSEPALRELIQDVWDDFQDATVPLPSLDETGPPTAPGGFRVHVFQDGDIPLTDVRTKSEAACVSARLHDRVRELRDELPQSVRIVGSLAGGRKTMSAALQTAFCLQARRIDRLVHVLLDAKVEAFLWEHRRMREFAYPTPFWAEATGVPVREQVSVYDVPFPRLRFIVPRRLKEALDGPSWNEVWPILEQNTECAARATLRRRGDRWEYRINNEEGVELYTAEMAHRPGSLLVAAVSIEGRPTLTKLVEWLEQHTELWSPTAVSPPSKEKGVQGAGRDLRAVLSDLPMGLEHFSLPASGYRIEGDVTVEQGAIAGIPILR